MGQIQGGYRGPDIVGDGLVLYLDANSRSSYQSFSRGDVSNFGNTWRDISGNGNNVTLTNGPTFSSNNGGVIVFDGSNDYAVKTSPSNIPNNQSAKTMSVWFYTTDTSTRTQQIFDSSNLAGGGGAAIQIEIRFDNTFSPNLPIRVGNWGGNIVVLSTISPSANTWYNVAFTTGGSGTTHRIYINGSLNNSATSSLQTGTTTNIFLATSNNGSEPLAGGIASALYYNRELTATEILQNYNATKARFGL